MKKNKVHKDAKHTISKIELRNMLAKALLPPPTQGRGGDQFPDVLVTSQTGQVFRFYSDLIRDKVVLVQFMSLDGQKQFPSLEHFSQIAQRLGHSLGKDVSMYSITTDPEKDTQARLAAYAKDHNIPAGWHLLSATDDSAKSITDRFAKHLSKHHHEGINMRMVHYGNGSVGLWGAFASDADPDMAVTRLGWLQNGSPVGNSIKRAGPIHLGKPQKDENSNRDV
jgi:hypothetical protein